MNVFLAVVLEAFGAHSKEKKGVVPAATFDSFVREWRRVDKDMDLFVTVPELLQILTRAPEPLGVGAPEEIAKQRERQMSSEAAAAAAAAASGGAAAAAAHTRRRLMRMESFSSRKHVSNALSTVYGNLNVSLFNGRVYVRAF